MRALFTGALLIGLVSVCEAKPLLIRWNPYQSPKVPVVRFVLYRAVGTTAALQPYAVIWDVKATAYADNAVDPAKGSYCYSIRTATADDILSPAPAKVCGKPNK